jgi:hypothetical protein
MEANQEVKTVTKPKNPGRVKAGKKMAELNKAKRLMTNNKQPTKQESQQQQYWIYGLLIVAGTGLVYYKVAKPITKEQPIAIEQPKETVITSDKPDPFVMK